MNKKRRETTRMLKLKSTAHRAHNTARDIYKPNAKLEETLQQKWNKKKPYEYKTLWDANEDFFHIKKAKAFCLLQMVSSRFAVEWSITK